MIRVGDWHGCVLKEAVKRIAHLDDLPQLSVGRSRAPALHETVSPRWRDDCQKLLALLELLLDARPRAIAKREIHEVLWPGTFVSDATAWLRLRVHRRNSPERLRPSEIEADDSRVYRIILGEREIALSKGEYVLGRASDAFVFVDDVGVSRHHARIRISGGSVVIEDLGSKNGTVVNGQTIDVPTTLVDGSLIVLGATTLKFRIFEASNSTDTVTRGVGA